LRSITAKQAARIDSESEIANFQKNGNEQLESATTSPTFLATGFQAITAETIEYSKKSLENGSAFVEKLLGAKSFQSAIHIRSEYTRTYYAALVAYLTKIGELNTKLAKEAFKRRTHVADEGTFPANANRRRRTSPLDASPGRYGSNN